MTLSIHQLLKISSVLAIATGIILVAGGVFGIWFTYNRVAQENIVTPIDADIPQKPVLGPFTLKAQADIIRKHTLKMTNGKTFAQMPRETQKTDEAGNPIIDASGQPVMTQNSARDIWITATTLTAALNVGIITYLFSGLLLLFGCISIWTGIIFHALSKKTIT